MLFSNFELSSRFATLRYLRQAHVTHVDCFCCSNQDFTGLHKRKRGSCVNIIRSSHSLANCTHHTFQPLCVCGFGLLHPVFCAGLPVPQPPLPPALHAPDAALVPPHAPAEGDAPEPELPQAVPPPGGEVPHPPPLPPPPPPGVPAVPHPEKLASCPHPAAPAAGGAVAAVPLAGGSCVPPPPPPSPPRVSSSFGSDLSPRTRFASFVCNSVRPCGKWSAMSAHHLA
jgi:hypothetical protein